jgi:hypothetical protein
MYRFFLFYLLFLLISCCTVKNGCNCGSISSGTFKLYENGKIIGYIYKDSSYQLEKYFDSSDIFIVKTKSENYNCNVYLKSVKIIEPFDTITWKLQYKRINNLKYSFIAKTAFIKLDYSYRGSIIKISNKIADREIMTKLDSLYNLKSATNL